MASTQTAWKLPTNTIYPNKSKCLIKTYIAESAISAGQVVGMVSGSDTHVEPTDLDATTGAAIIGVAGDNENQDDTNGGMLAWDADVVAETYVQVVVSGPVAVFTGASAIVAGIACGGSNDAGQAIQTTTIATSVGTCVLGQATQASKGIVIVGGL